MNKYETVFILNAELSEEKRNNAISKIKKYITDNGEIIREEDLGVKRLAYEIKKQNRGYYYVIYFMLDAKNIAELERLYRIADEVLKFIVVKMED